MDAGSESSFVKGSVYSRAQIRAALGGSGRAALPSRGGRVVCACLTLEKNPRAPAEVLLSGNGRSLRLARAFAASGGAIPVFVRARAGEWEYAGERRVRSLVEEPGALLALIAEGGPPDTALALLLEEAAPLVVAGVGEAGAGARGGVGSG